MSRSGRLCQIWLGRTAFRTGLILRNRTYRPKQSRRERDSGSAWKISRKLQLLRLIVGVWIFRLFRTGVKNPGWTLATVTGTIGIILLALVQFTSLPSETASASEPLFEPFLGISETDERNKEQAITEQTEIFSAQREPHSSQVSTDTKPDIEIDVILLPHPGFLDGEEQFLVTSVRGIHPLADIAAQREEESLWKPTGTRQAETEIQPTRHQDFAFGSENPFANPFENPFESGPDESESDEQTVQVPSSGAATAFTIVETSRLHLVVTLPEQTEVGRLGRIHFRVINVGRMAAENVTIGIEIPDKFKYHKGKSLEYKIGTIPPGETRLARLTPIAVNTGNAVYEIELTAEAGFSQILKKHVKVVVPD